MSQDEEKTAYKEAVKEQVKATISKASFWATFLYRFGIAISVTITLSVVTAGKNFVGGEWSDYKDMKRGYAQQHFIDSAQTAAILKMETRLTKVECVSDSFKIFATLKNKQ